MKRGEQKSGLASAEPLVPSDPRWNFFSVAAEAIIFASATAYAILAVALVIGAMGLIFTALFVGVQGFHAIGFMVGIAFFCVLVSLGLLMRAIVAWWLAEISAMIIVLFVTWPFTVPAQSRLQWIAIGFSVLFVSLILVRRYYFSSARQIWITS